MSLNQYDWGAIDPTTEDGTELATALNAWVAAVLSMHRGTDVPSYAVAGMIWPKAVSGTVEEIYYYDGSSSVLLATVNPTAHTAIFPAAALPAATTSAAGAAELTTTTEVLTGSDGSRVVTADSLAALWEDGGNISAISGGTVTLTEGGSFNLITSTATITAIVFATAKTGRRARVRFNTIRQLTHNASTFVLPGAANITTAVGDTCEVEDRGGGAARINEYTRADGTALAAASTVAFNHIGGLALSNNSGTPNTKIDVAAGQAADSTNAEMIDYAGGTLDLTTTGANGLRTGSLANNTSYAVFLIKGTSGVALFADTAITPGTRPAGYAVSWRRIGVFRTDGSAHVLGFFQVGRYFSWKDLSAISIASLTAGGAAVAIPILTGKKWLVTIRAQSSTGGASAFVVADPDGASPVPLPIGDFATTGGAAGAGNFQVVTDVSSQLKGQASVSSTISVLLVGWQDDGL